MLPLVALPLLLLGCASEHLTVAHEETPGETVSAYDRYFLVVAPPNQSDSKHWMIEKAIHDDLREKGYRPVDHDSADVIVRYELIIDEKHHEKRQASAQAAQANNGALPPSGEAEDSLTVSISKAADGKLIWRGESVGEAPPSHVTSTLMEGIERIMAGVPTSHDAGTRAPHTVSALSPAH
jgi:hypothetical protein